MKTLAKNFFLVLLILLGTAAIVSFFINSPQQTKQISLTQVAEDINQGKVKEIVISGTDLSITYQDNQKAVSKKEDNGSLTDSLKNLGVETNKLQGVQINPTTKQSAWDWIIPLATVVLPILIFGFFFWTLIRQAKAGAMQTFNFTKARIRLFGAEGHPKEKINFDDIADLKEAKEELREVVDFLKNPKKYLKMGAAIPRGVLLLGPAGVGKTLLARAVAGEANVPFFHISGSEFVEMFVGVGASRVRDLFQTAKKAAPSIVFIDELDAIGRQRGTGLGGGHDEREQTLNQILVEMDGFERDTQVIVVAATNRGDILDSALLRPGRFDRKVVLDLPDVVGREEVLKIHCKGKPLASDIKLREIAERTPGFSGADMANVANEAAILAARKNKTQIFQSEFLESIEKVLLGPERKSFILSKKEKEIAAFHEAGHALVSTFLAKSEPVRKISIIARGMAAGYTLKLPSEEKRIRTKTEFLGEISTLLGGYSAEKIVFREITTGASNDLEKASELARRLVKDFGMSALGPISFGETDDLSFFGQSGLSEKRNYSEKTAVLIDDEVEKIIRECQKEAERLLMAKRNLLEKIARRLMEKETIEREEFDAIIKGGNAGENKTNPPKNQPTNLKIHPVK